MRKALAMVAFVAALFIAGNVQAQKMVYAAYAPETFTAGNTSFDYQGFALGFAKNFGLAKNVGVAVGGQFRLNTRTATQTIWGFTGKVKENQLLIDVPVLFNYKIGVNRDLAIIPFVGPMPSLALTGTTKGADPIFGENSSNWYGDNSNRSRFNLYVVFGADVKYTDYNLFGGYRLGLLDLNKSDNASLKANGFFIGIGYTIK